MLLLLFSLSVMSDSLRPHLLQHTRLPCLSLLFLGKRVYLPGYILKLMSIELMMPFNHLILSPPSPPAFNLSHHQGLFQWVSSSHQMAKVLEFQLQHQSFQPYYTLIPSSVFLMMLSLFAAFLDLLFSLSSLRDSSYRIIFLECLLTSLIIP